MSKYSVKKPFTVLVGILMILVLGFVSFMKMSTDLYPSMSLPYIQVITTYPGASPEKVEMDVSKVLESGLGTVSALKNISSTSNENYSLVTLEFEDDTNMDSAMARVSRQIDQLKLPETCGTPFLLEMSPDMIATMQASITYEGKDKYELSDFVMNTVVPYLERQEGVADISTTGDIENSVEVRLDKEKVDAINAKLLKKVNSKLEDAQKKISDSKDDLNTAKSKIDSGKKTLQKTQNTKSKELAAFTKQLNEAVSTRVAYEAQVSGLNASKAALEAEKNGYQSGYDSITAVITQISSAMPAGSGMPVSVEDAIANNGAKLSVLTSALTAAGQTEAVSQLTLENLTALSNGVKVRVPQIDTELSNLNTEILAANTVVQQVKKQISKAEKNYVKVEQGKITAAAAFGSSDAQMAASKTAIEDGEKKLEEAQDSYNDSLETARKNANLDSLLNLDTLSKMIGAQNFDMPAGYVSSKDKSTDYLIKVGEEYQSIDELKNTVLCNVDGIGDVKLNDVAQITMIDNGDDSYANINGEKAVVVSATKLSTAFTSDVSDNLGKAITDLEKKYKGLHFTVLFDQGDYIDIIVDSVMKNLIYGAILAIIVLLIFLRDPRPTIVVAFSIPLSVLFAIVLMYFSNTTLNIISLSGLALGIGMLVDNSIVVIENIYRLRSLGVSRAKAAVMGAKQVGGAITASTLTTICVFLPILFTDGITRTMMMDMCLTITYSLVASLIVAMTVVPAMSSTLLKKEVTAKHRWFDAMLVGYEKILRFCLKRKFVPICVAIVLLGLCIWRVTVMGIVLMPEMGSNQMSVTVDADDELTTDEIFELGDEVTDIISKVDGVKTVGAMSGSGYSIAGLDMGQDGVSSFTYYIMLEDDYYTKNKKVADTIEKKLKDVKGEVTVSASNMDTSALFGSGLSIKIEGDDLDKLLSISDDVKKMVEEVPGFTDISNGQEEADEQLKVIVDKNKAAKLGLTVAQVYQEISAGVTTEKEATTLTVEGEQYTVNLVDETDVINSDNILNHKFTTKKTDDEGKEVEETHKLKEFAKVEKAESMDSISRDNQARYITVSAGVEDGKNVTLLSRDLQKLIDKYDAPSGYTIEIQGETESVNEVVKNMVQMMLLAFVFIYLIMVAQFQSLLSPFIVIFTIPLAFTGGLLALIVTGEQMTMMSMMGFLILMGVIVNNGIVFVDYANQLRIYGIEKKEALVQTGKTRMRPILMTTLTTVCSMSTMIFGSDMGSEMGKGMALVVIGGLLYATLMTLFIVPVLYDILFRREPKIIDVEGEIEEAVDVY